MSVSNFHTISCGAVTIGDNGYCDGGSASKHTCAMVQASLIDAINDPNYFIKRIKYRIELLEKSDPVTKMNVMFDLNKTILTIDEVKGYGRREIILLETFKKDAIFLKWCFSKQYDGNDDAPEYTTWLKEFSKSSNEPELIELAAEYCSFKESEIEGVGHDNVVTSFWNCLDWMDRGGDNGNIEFYITFRTFGTDLSSMFNKIEACGYGHLITLNRHNGQPVIHKIIHRISDDYFPSETMELMIGLGHVIKDERGIHWITSDIPVPGPKLKDSPAYKLVTVPFEDAAIRAAKKGSIPKPFIYMKDMLEGFGLDTSNDPFDYNKCFNIETFSNQMKLKNSNSGMIKSMVGVQDNYKPWSRKNWKAGKPISTVGHIIYFDDYNYSKVDEDMGTYISALYEHNYRTGSRLITGTKSELMTKFPLMV